MQTVSLGLGRTAATGIDERRFRSGNNMTLTMTGLEGGFSAFNIHNASGNITIDAGAMTGTIDVTRLELLGKVMQPSLLAHLETFPRKMFIPLTFTLDASAHLARVLLLEQCLYGAVNISLGSGSGDFIVNTVMASQAGDVIIDGSNFGGTMDATKYQLFNLTVSMGTQGDFSADNAGLIAVGNFLLTGLPQPLVKRLQGVTAGGNITISGRLSGIH